MGTLLALTFFTVLILIATVLPLSRHTHWMVRGMDFPRLQIVTVATAVLIASLVWLDFTAAVSWVLITITAACLLWQLWWVLPYTPLWRKEVVTATKNDIGDDELSIITANVLMTNRNSQPLIDLVNEYKPDVLVTLESDNWWEKQLETIESAMPFTVKCPRENLYGMHVYSRKPLSNTEISYLIEPDIPSIHTALTLRSNNKIRMHFVHPAPPSPTENTHSIERDAELVVLARSIADTNSPVIVTGDLNDVAWSTTTRLFRKISGLLDPRVGRGMFNTFHASYVLLRWPLDYIFHSEHFKVKTIKRLPPIGSDHFALFTTLVFNSNGSNENQEGLEANQKDIEMAKEISNEMNVVKSDIPKPL